MRDCGVTLVMPSASPTGGAEEAFLQLLKSEAAEEVRWQVIFLEEGPLIQYVRPYCTEAHVVRCTRTRNLWRWWKAAGEIASLAKQIGSELIFGWMTKGHVYGGLAGWRAGLPTAWFQHGIPNTGMLDRIAIRIPTQAIFACSSFVADLQRKQQPGKKVFCVYPGVDLARFNPSVLPETAATREQLGLPANSHIIGIVGRLQRWKGMHILLDAMANVCREYNNARCLVVGGIHASEPDYLGVLQRQANELGIADQVIFAGPQSNVPLWIHSMDIFVHASDCEPLGIVVLEAMALGKPTIASVPGGPAEIISDGKNGIVVPSNDCGQLTNAIRRFLSDKSFAKQCGQAAKIRASSFTSERLGTCFCDHIKKLVPKLATMSDDSQSV